MSRSTLRAVILVTGVITALIHLVLLNLFGQLFPMFILNGLGYLILLGAFYFNPSIVATRRTLLHWVFIGFTALTIIAWFLLADLSAPLGIITKIDEVVLIIALWLHMSQEQQSAAAA